MMPARMDDWLVPDWRPHPRVSVLVTTRRGHFSPAPWAGFNLGNNSGDDPQRVEIARRHVWSEIATPLEPVWLKQVHGIRCIQAGDENTEADGVWSKRPGQPCAVLTADCLPVLMARTDGTAVGAFHAGWRGLQAGILERAAMLLAPLGESLSAWIGPAISRSCYQVGDEVRAAFLADDAQAASAFQQDGPGHWLMDLSALARQRLAGVGVADVQGGDLCTFSSPQHYYSYRREGQTGRFASLIWLNT